LIGICELEKALIPPSPIVTSSYYDTQTKELVLQVENPGYMPITMLTKSLVFRPADPAKQAVTVILEVQLNIDILPQDKATIRLQLDPQTAEVFGLGDVLVATLTYKLPISRDIYSVVHLFKHA